MGLNCTHGCWDGSYSSFMKFRIELASFIGIPLLLMEGFYSPEEHPELNEDVKSNLPLEWGSFKPDVLHVLLHHSDCDGEIPWYVCQMLADRMKEIKIASRWGDGVFISRLDAFITGLELAAKEKEDVGFH